LLDYLTKSAVTKSPEQPPERVVEFLRKRDYVLVRELGNGACGRTVLLRDDTLDQHFVCKKYVPSQEPLRKELFAGFLKEIKLLHQLQHPNVVRVFNYYLYPELTTGYILMEYVDGQHIDTYLQNHPERINETFLQVVAAFAYLERNNVLHRDIRPANVMVTADGTVKVIDLGFGKRITRPDDFDKSISLNWWCDPPEEFGGTRYDFGTESYLVGKLCEKQIQERGLEQFRYRELLVQLCHWRADRRIRSFSDVIKAVEGDPFYEIEFSTAELSAFRDFAKEVASHVTKISRDAKYIDDIERVRGALERAYQTCMLAETVPDCVSILTAILAGQFYYRKAGFPVSAVRDFLRLLKSVSVEKERIVMTNVWTRLDAISRYAPAGESFDDDIPF